MNDLKTKTNEYWSGLADKFDKITFRVVGKETVEHVLHELANLPELGNMIELGCGTSMYSRVLSERAETLLCTDFSDQMLSISKEKMKDIPNVKVEKADCCDLPYEDGTFDSVFMANLLHIVPDIDKAMSEAIRVLKRGGAIIALDYNMKHMTFSSRIRMVLRFLRHFSKPPHKVTPVSDDVMRELFLRHGLTIDFVKIIGCQSKATYGRAFKD